MAPLKAVTLPRLELLRTLVTGRLSSRVQKIIRKKKGLSADSILSNNKWWNGPALLKLDKLPETVFMPELNEEEHFPEAKIKGL
ncbi:hypothetical protein TNCV_4515781 [Trichonephila clavipes]|nr:hypothetical protein TNCV_4515781 [Trichonephila clavipes]